LGQSFVFGTESCSVYIG